MIINDKTGVINDPLSRDDFGLILNFWKGQTANVKKVIITTGWDSGGQPRLNQFLQKLNALLYNKRTVAQVKSLERPAQTVLLIQKSLFHTLLCPSVRATVRSSILTFKQNKLL